MTQKPPRSPRAALFIGAALLATPAFAQDAPTQTVTPPPVVSTVPQTTPAPAPAPAVTFAPAAPTVQTVPEVPKAQTPPRTATRTTTARTTTTRQTTRSTAPAATRPAPAPVTAPAPAPAPQAATPVEQPAPTAVTPPEPAPAAPVQQADTTTTTTDATPRQTALWPWLLGGALIIVGVIAALLFRRRREYDEVYEEPYEPAYVAEPEPVAERTYVPRHEPEVAPIAAAAPVVIDEPVAIAEDAEIAKADAGDLADLTAASPVAHRPWLEFGMRPVRAGTSSDEALVELELTVANSGDMPAKDVRISTFLLKDADAGEMERMLLDRDEPTVPPVTIPAGEGTRVDATLAVRKDEVAANGDRFSPVVVADARYTMADGTEGRTSATFRVGLWNDGDGIEPIGIGRPQMHDNVAAELHGTPEHA